jgi:hypothetical protein
MTKRVQWLALLLLCGVWAGVAVWLVSGKSEPPRAPLKYRSGQTASKETSRSKAGGGLHVKVDLFTAGRRQAEKPFASPKNIFAQLQTEKSKGVGRGPSRALPAPPVSSASPGGSAGLTPALPSPEQKAPAPVPPPPPTPEELAVQAAKAELAQYRFLGYLSQTGKEEAFLSKGKDLLIVQAGETLDKGVYVKAVSSAGVTLLETRSRVEQTVAATGEKK